MVATTANPRRVDQEAISPASPVSDRASSSARPTATAASLVWSETSSSPSSATAYRTRMGSSRKTRVAPSSDAQRAMA